MIAFEQYPGTVAIYGARGSAGVKPCHVPSKVPPSTPPVLYPSFGSLILICIPSAVNDHLPPELAPLTKLKIALECVLLER